jgi:hypothetical protein
LQQIIFAENLVEHDFDVVAGVPVAVVIKAAGHAWLLQLKWRERHAPATRIVRQSFRHAWSLEKIREMKRVLPSSFPSPLGYQRSFKASSPSSFWRGATLDETG